MNKRLFGIMLCLMLIRGAEGDAMPKSTGPKCELRGNDNGNIYLGEFRPNNFHFILTSDKNGLKVFQEWCSWGYYARWFEAVDEEDPHRRYRIARRGGAWTKNFM